VHLAAGFRTSRLPAAEEHTGQLKQSSLRKEMVSSEDGTHGRRIEHIESLPWGRYFLIKRVVRQIR
jgi:hypothetical protein